jgi:hypothetical protein
MFAWAWQLPWHAAWHVTGLQLGAVPVQLPWHSAPHVSLHEASHCAELALLEQSPVQWASQLSVQEPSQLKLPLVQPPVQLDSHDAVQLASMFTLHWPLQLASSCAEHCTSTLMGVHCAVHPPDVSSVHVSVPLKSMFPHSEMTVAPAVAGEKTTNAPTMPPATAAKSDERRNMASLLGADCLKSAAGRRATRGDGA